MSLEKTNTDKEEKNKQTKDEDIRRYFLGKIFIPNFFITFVSIFIPAYIAYESLVLAAGIRTFSLKEFGMVIHQFDPWFNFRATQYLSKHGWYAFFHWFDYMVWYPLGRPVGTTIYPGLQITAVAILKLQTLLGKGYVMSLNDICCTIPCWGGSMSTLFLALITYEATDSGLSAAFAAALFSINPAHLMRSMGGDYDNECIAMTAMLMTFYFWIRSLRTPSSWPIGILAGLAYGYMVATWGGYIFVLNMIALHVTVSVLYDWIKNTYNKNLFYAYSLFYVIGTLIATRVPPVNTSPFRSLEQLSATFVFFTLITLHFSEFKRKTLKISKINSKEGLLLRAKYFSFLLMILTILISVLIPTGFFGPLSPRVRSLFLKHTRTGNPLVDSVAEHQPANSESFWKFLHFAYYGWGLGAFLCTLIYRSPRLSAMTFLLIYNFVAYYFSLKMTRLILLSGPIACAMSGIFFGVIINWCLDQIFFLKENEKKDIGNNNTTETKKLKKKMTFLKEFDNIKQEIICKYEKNWHFRVIIGSIVFCVITISTPFLWKEYKQNCNKLATMLGNPRIMFKTQLSDGRIVTVDDYREAYFWLRDKTPKDSRVMAWWDYGYQITGIGNRTSIADGNTWNHEHIATLGKCLISPVPEAHSLIRHLADYVLVWAGTRGDDLAKSPHMVRIANSVYNDICPDDPLCLHFGFYNNDYRKPTPSMKKSLLFNLHSHNIEPGFHVNPEYFKETYKSKFGLVRIFKVMNVSQESKDWVADPKNRICDAPGSWYCVGQYPPAPEIKALLAKRRDFVQIGDFNKNKGNSYHKEYMKRMKQ